MDNTEINKSSMLRIGTLLRGIYRIDSYLSSGGFGNTYMATNVEFDERYAIKEFFMKGTTQRNVETSQVSVSNAENVRTFEEQREKFKKEARRLRKLDNPYIVRVHDMFEENGTAYYVMDYVDGENLKTRLERTGRPMTEKEVMAILPQILNALKSVHDEGLWHFDLKPANIMVDKKGTVKLIDFGASKQLSKNGATVSVTESAVAYSKHYAPREQMEQNYAKFGPWTDLYALGATLYDLLVKKKPPMPSDIDDDKTPDKRVALPLPSTLSEKTRHLVLWLMETNRMNRPQSVDEVLKFLDSEETTIKDSEKKSSGETTIIENQKKSDEETEIKKERQNTANNDKPRSRKNVPPKKKDAPNPNSSRELLIVFMVSLAAILVIILIAYNEKKTTGNSAFVESDSILVDSILVDSIVINNKVYGEGTYGGERSNGVPDGKGSACFISADHVWEYEGDWKKGVIDGNGKMTYSNKEGVFVMQGKFKNNQFVNGRYTKPDGTYFKGDFKNEEPYTGTWYKKNGKVDYKYLNGDPV